MKMKLIPIEHDHPMIEATLKAGREGFHFEIPGPARGKGRPRFGKSRAGFVTVRTDDKTAAYENLIKLAAREAGAKLMTGPLWVTIVAFYAPPPSWSKKRKAEALRHQIYPKQFDVDNIAKAVLDGLNGVAFADDKQVVMLDVSKYYAQRSHCGVSILPAGAFMEQAVEANELRPSGLE